MSKANFDVKKAMANKQGIPLSQAHQLIGQELFASDWWELTDERVRMFRKSIGAVPEEADMTACLVNPVGDDNVDATMLVGVIQTMHFNHNPIYTFGSFALNYGYEKIRVPQSAFIGQKVRCVCTLADVQEHPRGYMLITDNVLELEGSDRPALTARWLVVMVLPDALLEARAARQ